MSYDYALQAIGAVADPSFDYGARALELANQSMASIGSFAPYALVVLDVNGTNPRVTPFQDQNAANAAFKPEADTLSAKKAYVGLFDTRGMVRERYYGWSSSVDATLRKLAPLAVPILVVGGLIAAAVLYSRSAKPGARRRAARRPSSFRRKTITTWRR